MNRIYMYVQIYIYIQYVYIYMYGTPPKIYCNCFTCVQYVLKQGLLTPLHPCPDLQVPFFRNFDTLVLNGQGEAYTMCIVWR